MVGKGLPNYLENAWTFDIIQKDKSSSPGRSRAPSVFSNVQNSLPLLLISTVLSFWRELLSIFLVLSQTSFLHQLQIHLQTQTFLIKINTLKPVLLKESGGGENKMWISLSFLAILIILGVCKNIFASPKAFCTMSVYNGSDSIFQNELFRFVILLIDVKTKIIHVSFKLTVNVTMS